MSIANPPSDASNYQIVWRNALEHLNRLEPGPREYSRRLTDEENNILRDNISPSDVLLLLQKTRVSTRLRLSWVAHGFAEPESEFRVAFESAASRCSGIGGPIWAPIKIILQLVMAKTGEFEKIAEFLKDMLKTLELFQKVVSRFEPSRARSWDHLYNALEFFYVDVIDFALITVKHYRTSATKNNLRKLRKAFGGDFGNVVSNMARHLDSVSPVMHPAARSQDNQGYEDDDLHDEDIAVGLDGGNLTEGRNDAIQIWLSGTAMETDQQTHQSNQLRGTCKWFFKNLDFIDWLRSKHSSSLCVLGIPGCGKSTLMSSLIHRLKSNLANGEPVLYFFCNEGDRSRDSPSLILRTMLSQLFNHPTYGPAFVYTYHAKSTTNSMHNASVHDLWNLLENMVSMIPVVYLVIDGLDECGNNEGEMVDFLARLTTLSTSDKTVAKVIATCRPNTFEIAWPTVIIDTSQIQGDINAYITNRTQKSVIFGLPQYRDMISSAIQQGAETFLWARLMLDTLEKSSPREIGNVLRNIPCELSDVYALILHSFSSLSDRSIKRCQKIIYWCAAACRLLTVDELLMAISISEGVSSQEEFSTWSDRVSLMQLLRNECSSLVTLRKDNCLQLVHTSLREYLLGEEWKASRLSMRVTNIEITQVHIDMARICIRYNRFPSFHTAVTKVSSLEDFDSVYPFSRYSTSNWIYHVTTSGDSFDELSNDIVGFLSSPKTWRMLLRYQDYNLSLSQLLDLQGKLKTWMGLRTENQPDQDNFELIRNFVPHLTGEYYKEIRRENGETHLRTAQAAYVLGFVYRSQCGFDTALEYFEQALTGMEESLGMEHPSTMHVVTAMAAIYHSQARYDEALGSYKRALAGNGKLLGADDPSTLNIVDNIGSVYSAQGRFEEALQWYEIALAGRERTLGMEHSSTLLAVNNIAVVYSSQGRYDESLKLHERALAGIGEALGMAHPSTLQVIHNIAAIYSNQGRYDEAHLWYSRTLDGMEKSLGMEHPSTLHVINNFSTLCSTQGRYDEALQWSVNALERGERILGREHPSTLKTVDNIASVYSHLGRYQDALEWHERALAGMTNVLGEEHPSTLEIVNSIGSTYSALGRYDDALNWHRRALSGFENTLGTEHPSMLDTINSIAVVYCHQERYNEALEWYERALAGSLKIPGAEHPRTLGLIGNIAGVHCCQGQYDDALIWFQRALAGQEKALGMEHLTTLGIASNIGTVYSSQGRYDEALKWHERALAGTEKAVGREHPVTLDIVNNIGVVCVNLGRYNEALKWYERALAGKAKILGKDHPSTLRVAENTNRTRQRVKDSSHLYPGTPRCW